MQVERLQLEQRLDDLDCQKSSVSAALESSTSECACVQKRRHRRVTNYTANSTQGYLPTRPPQRYTSQINPSSQHEPERQTQTSKRRAPVLSSISADSALPPRSYPTVGLPNFGVLPRSENLFRTQMASLTMLKITTTVARMPNTYAATSAALFLDLSRKG